MVDKQKNERNTYMAVSLVEKSVPMFENNYSIILKGKCVFEGRQVENRGHSGWGPKVRSSHCLVLLSAA